MVPEGMTTLSGDRPTGSIHGTRSPVLPVVDAAGVLVGVVSLERLAAAAAADERPASIAGLMDDARQTSLVATDRLETVLARLGETDLNALVVVASEDDPRPVGVVTRGDVMTIYQPALRTR